MAQRNSLNGELGGDVTRLNLLNKSRDRATSHAYTKLLSINRIDRSLIRWQQAMEWGRMEAEEEEEEEEEEGRGGGGGGGGGILPVGEKMVPLMENGGTECSRKAASVESAAQLKLIGRDSGR